MAHHLGEEVLERGLIALLTVHRDAHTGVRDQCVDEAVGEESQRIDAAKLRIEGLAGGHRWARVWGYLLPILHHTLLLEGVENRG